MSLQKAIDKLTKELKTTENRGRLFYASQDVVIQLKDYSNKTERYISGLELDQYPLRVKIEELTEENKELRDLCCKIVDIMGFELYMARKHSNVKRRPEYGSKAYNEILKRVVSENKANRA